MSGPLDDPAERTLGAVFPTPFDPSGTSFSRVLRQAAPSAAPSFPADGDVDDLPDVVEGTTVLAATYADGVVVVGDRRATAGNFISKTDMRKVFSADRWSAVAISGVAGPAMELARVFSTELEHYEKVEGEPLSMDGKSNKLAHMVRANLALTMQGMVVVPLFAGVRPNTTEGKIFEYDPIGGRYRARKLAASGSGSIVARGTLKRRHDPDHDRDTTVEMSVAALFDAAEEDSATGGPDLIRRIYPIVAVVDGDGYRELEDEEVADHVDSVVEHRRTEDPRAAS